MHTTAATIEAILFATAEMHSVSELAALIETSEEAIEEGLAALATSLTDHGMVLVREGNTVTLATRPEHALILEKIRKDELSKDLSKASAETLAVICYHPGATKAEIELVRGVNASYSLRALQMRGLIEQRGSGRSTIYVPTLDLLQSYGVATIEAMPRYTETKQKIDALLQGQNISAEQQS